MDISNQLIKNSYNYVLQSDLATGVIYRIGGQVPFNPIFQSGLTIFDSFRYSNGSEQNGYVLICDASGNTTWQPFSGYSVSSLTTGVGLSANTNIGNITLINTLPDQVVSLSNGQYIAVSGTYPNFTISTTGITDNDKFISGFTYNNNTFTLVDNSGTTLSATINSVTGLTINGNLIVTGNTNLNSISAATIGTSANCVNDIYVTNLRACSPLNINPLDEGNVYFGSTSAVTIDLSNNRVGIGTVSPAQQLHIASSNARVRLESSATNIWDLVSNIGGGSNNDFVVQASGTRGVIYLGAYATTNTVSVLSNGALVVNSTGNSSFSGTGNVGIGTTSPTSRLQVRGLGSTSSSTAFRVENSASTVSMAITDGGNTGLGVVPTVRLDIQGTTGTDGGQLGSELLSSANWTSVGWTGNYINGFTHTTGNTSVLSNTLAAVVNNYYQIAYTITGRTAGSVTIAFGGQSNATITATGIFGPRATTTGNLTITPTTDFDGTISAISIKQITTGTALINLRNSSGTVTNEIRAHSLTSNTFVGVNAGSRTTTGTNNAAFGTGALQNNTTGGSNVAIGNAALQFNTTANSNTAVGQASLFSNTTGFGNTGVGNNTLQNNTTASNNTAIGYAALFPLTTGGSNTALGTNAGRYISGGAVNLTNSSSSVFIGNAAYPLADSQTNQIVIGDSAVGLGSNTAILGSSAITRTHLQGNVSIGTTGSISTRLEIQGTTSTDGGQLGAELLSAANWTSTDWTGDYNVGFTHTTGNTSVLSNTLAAVIGTYYQISYTITGRTAGSVTIAFGGQSLASITATGAFGPLATTTGNLTITPTSDFNGTIVISIRAITAGTALISLRNSSGTITNEIRTLSSNSNTIIGLNAGSRTTTGTNNVALGRTALQQNTTGTGNVALGVNALLSNTFGGSNIGIGTQALQNNINGSSNIAVGLQALLNNTTGGSNTAVGTQSLSGNTTGANNVAVGSLALQANTTASSNTAVGASALNANTIGATNVAVGNSALLLNVTGSSNVAIGVSALRNTTTGSLTAVGTTALQNNTTGTGNVAFGSSALNANTTGTSNTAVGNSALLLNTTGGSNIGIGQLSLSTIVSGSSNVAIGVSALRNTTSSSQTAVGTSALQSNTTGTFNTAIGTQTLQNNLIGNSNTAVGNAALFANTADSNTAVGNSSLNANTVGTTNTAVGASSLLLNISGSSNVAIGANALRNTISGASVGVGTNVLQNNTTSTSNTAVGTSALASITTNGSQTALGAFALTSITGGTSNVAIGVNAGRYISGASTSLTVSSTSIFIGNTTQALADSQSNQIVIGDTAVGLGSNTTVIGNTSTTLFRPYGNVAIGTNSASASLHVNNSNTATTTALFSGSGQNVLRVVGSGSTQPIFTVQGSSGELFSVTDSLIGSLYSVNDITGLPVLEVFSDNTILMGSYQAPSLNSSTKVIATTGTTNIYSIPTSAYTGAFFDYTVSDGTNLRAGNIMSIWSGTSVNMTEVKTTDFGSTTGLTFNMVVSSGNAILRTSGVTGNWTVKTIVRSI